jgi:hypothetical protein
MPALCDGVPNASSWNRHAARNCESAWIVVDAVEDTRSPSGMSLARNGLSPNQPRFVALTTTSPAKACTRTFCGYGRSAVCWGDCPRNASPPGRPKAPAWAGRNPQGACSVNTAGLSARQAETSRRRIVRGSDAVAPTPVFSSSANWDPVCGEPYPITLVTALPRSRPSTWPPTAYRAASPPTPWVISTAFCPRALVTQSMASPSAGPMPGSSTQLPALAR